MRLRLRSVPLDTFDEDTPTSTVKKLKTIYRFVLIGALVLYVLLNSLVLNLLALLVLAGFFYYYRVTVRIKQQALNAALAYTSLAENSYFVYLRSFDSAGRRKIRTTLEIGQSDRLLANIGILSTL